jgi:hypothetical protein
MSTPPADRLAELRNAVEELRRAVDESQSPETIRRMIEGVDAAMGVACRESQKKRDEWKWVGYLLLVLSRNSWNASRPRERP